MESNLRKAFSVKKWLFLAVKTVVMKKHLLMMSNTKKSQLSKKVPKTASIQTPLEPEDDLKYEVVTL